MGQFVLFRILPDPYTLRHKTLKIMYLCVHNPPLPPPPPPPPHHHHHHLVILIEWSFLTLSCHLSLSSITLGRSSKLHLVSTQS